MAVRDQTRLVKRAGGPPPKKAPKEPAHPLAVHPLSRQKLLFCSANSDVTDSPSELRRMASANRKATDSWRIFLQAFAASDKGMVLVMTTSSSCEALMRSMAGPENTACVQ